MNKFIDYFEESWHQVSWKYRQERLSKTYQIDQGVAYREIDIKNGTTRFSCGPKSNRDGLANYLDIKPFPRPEPIFDNIDCLDEKEIEVCDSSINTLIDEIRSAGITFPIVTLRYEWQKVFISLQSAKNKKWSAKAARLHSRLTVRGTVSQNSKKIVHLSVTAPDYPFALDKNQITRLINQFLYRSHEKIESVSVPHGLKYAVLGSGEVGAIVHECCHLLEADQPYSDKLFGRRLSNHQVTIVDNPTLLNIPGAMEIDDEGEKCSPSVLIEQGVCVSLIHSKATWATRSLGQKTANARRQNYRHLPYPRLTITYLKPGKISKADIIEDTNKGIFIAELANTKVDPNTLTIHATISLGYIINKGKLERPCRGILKISVFDYLEGIDAVGDDLLIVPGHGLCGKRGQFVPVSYGQPTTRLHLPKGAIIPIP